jgi:hypothetical protein
MLARQRAVDEHAQSAGIGFVIDGTGLVATG